METELEGGFANRGAVVRSGAYVLRPSNDHTPTIHRFLHHLDRTGFDGASVPIGVDADGRERLRYLPGAVPLPPYPEWARTDAALASVARLLRRFHDAAASFAPRVDDTWSSEMADPNGGSTVCHNDVCLENVVFRDGEAVGLLDFDFAAPGNPIYDLACFSRMCVPIDDESRFALGWRPSDLPARLRLVADAYELQPHQRVELIEQLDVTIGRGGLFLQCRVEAGDPNFTEMWASIGGMTRFDNRRDWWNENHIEFEAAMR